MSTEHSCALKPIRETGSSRKYTISATYEQICDRLGPPNVTDLDDPWKVKASWGFVDESTQRKGFVWCYMVRQPKHCTEWSASGDASLLAEIFGDMAGAYP
jgi:hypothetical protein